MTSQAVPQKNASSAAANSLRSMSRSTTSMPRYSSQSVITVRRVMLSRMSLVTGGVTALPSRIMNTHMPGPSATLPLLLSRMAVSYPSARACRVASRPFW